MSSVDDADQRFVKRLLASARDDEEPGDIAGAWARFTGALQALAVTPAAGRRLADSADPPGRAAAPPIRRMVAFKAWLLGAVVGSGVTGAVLVRHAVWTSHEADADHPSRVVPTAAPPAAASDLSAAVPDHVPVLSAPATPKRRAASARPALVGAASGGRIDGAPGPASRLADEVARIDDARTAAAMGDHDEAIALVDRYHRDFPGGALAADAEVVALEALAAKHDTAELARRAALFLARYPRDPHAARVRNLAEQPGRGAR